MFSRFPWYFQKDQVKEGQRFCLARKKVKNNPKILRAPPKESISSRFSVIFESISFSVATRKRPKIDSKMTEKRLEIDSLGGGLVVVRGESRGWAAAEKKQCH